MDYNVVSAALVIALVPMIIVFLLFQKQFIKGMIAGAIK